MARTDNGRDGKLIDTWHWKYNGVEDDLSAHLKGEDSGGPEENEGEDKRPKLVAEKAVALEVRMLKSMVDGPLPRAEKAVEFVVINKDLGIRLIGSDIEVLRKAAWAKLEKQFEIKWEEWYLVTIASAGFSYRGIEVGFTLAQQSIHRGVAHDGSVLMREYERGRTSSPWRYKAWPGVYQDNGGTVIACIKATEANDKAMNEFRARIRELQKRLSELVKPENIMQTLANLSGIGLPAPDTKQVAEGDQQ